MSSYLIFRFFLAICVVFVLLFLIWWIVKNRKFPWIKVPAKELRHIEGIYLSTNVSLHIVRFRDQYFLIGCSPSSIVLLKEFSDYEKKDKEDIRL
jgi:flagellar biogenesis protein FliO